MVRAHKGLEAFALSRFDPQYFFSVSWRLSPAVFDFYKQKVCWESV